jgi:amino acid transporter
MSQVIWSTIISGIAIFLALALGIGWELGLGLTSATMVVAGCVALMVAFVGYRDRDKSPWIRRRLRAVRAMALVGVIASTIMLALYYSQREWPFLLASVISAVGLIVLVIAALCAAFRRPRNRLNMLIVRV